MLLEWIHILNSIILLGTAVGSAFFLFAVNRSRDVSSIGFVTRHVVRANWIFTLPTGIIQLVTGMILMRERDYTFAEGWLLLAASLYLLATLCWIGVALTQGKMRNIAKVALESGTELPVAYWNKDKLWSILAVIAFLSIAGVSYLMVVKPQIAFLSGVVSRASQG